MNARNLCKRATVYGELSAPHIRQALTPPQFTQIQDANTAFKGAFYQENKTGKTLYFRCTFLIIRCILIFSSTHYARSSTIICFVFPLYIPLGHNQTAQKRPHIKNAHNESNEKKLIRNVHSKSANVWLPGCKNPGRVKQPKRAKS